MNKLLSNLMAQLESWESAAEFGIPEESWADYDVRRRSADLYISSLSCIFDALRIEDDSKRLDELNAIAKTLVIFSRSAASKHLNGVERNLNQLYSAALFYLADRPATATFLAKSIVPSPDFNEEELFLRSFLANSTENKSAYTEKLKRFLADGEPKLLSQLCETLTLKVAEGLQTDPRLFIAAKLSLNSLERFKETNVWSNLQKSAAKSTPDLWRRFFFNSESFPMREFLPSQLVALDAGLLVDKPGVVSLQMPTSAGKTSLCEILIFHETMGLGRKVLFLVPFRALAAEIAAGMSGRLEAAGVKIIASYGGNLPTKSETASLETSDVLVVTPEKFSALTQVIPEFEMRFHTIICDEGQLIDDESRGLPYELLLARLHARRNNKDQRIVFISAILPNMSDIHTWLGGKSGGLASSSYKPVDVDYAFLTKDPGNRWFLDINPQYERPRSYFLKDFLVSTDFAFTNATTGRSNYIANRHSFTSLTCAAALRARCNGPVAVFTTTRGDHGIEGLSNKLIELCESKASVSLPQVPSSPQNSAIIELLEFSLGPQYQLCRLMKHGIGFHHGNLPQELRRLMEEGIANGAVGILLCTSTLAEGVNMPIRTLIIQTFRRYDENIKALAFIPNRNIKNIIGRVGRAGKETRGRVVFINSGERESVLNVLNDVGLEPATGRLHQLVELLEKFFREKKIKPSNEFFEAQEPWFLDLIDGIDHSMINLIPEGESADNIAKNIDALLDRTLAKHLGKSKEFREVLHLTFKLRGENLQKTIAKDSWQSFRQSGATPRLWRRLLDSKLSENVSWTSLRNASDPLWIDNVIAPLIKLTIRDSAVSPEVMNGILLGWIEGKTYLEISVENKIDVDAVLGVLSNEVGFKLQENVSRLSQMALHNFGPKKISEIAQAWPSLLQFGLGTLQQLDLYERGASDRLGVWGIWRLLESNNIDLRGKFLIQYLRKYGGAVRDILGADKRVPALSRERVCRELRLPEA